MSKSFFQNPVMQNGQQKLDANGKPIFAPTMTSKFLANLPDASSLTPPQQQSAPPVSFNIPQAQQFQGPDTSFLQRRQPSAQAFFGG